MNIYNGTHVTFPGSKKFASHMMYVHLAMVRCYKSISQLNDVCFSGLDRVPPGEGKAAVEVVHQGQFLGCGPLKDYQLTLTHFCPVLWRSHSFFLRHV